MDSMSAQLFGWRGAGLSLQHRNECPLNRNRNASVLEEKEKKKKRGRNVLMGTVRTLHCRRIKK